MATFVLTDASVTINSVDLSDHCTSVEISYEADAVEDTNMGDDTHIQMGGLKTWSMSFEFSQDYAAGKVDATLWPLVGTTTALVVLPTSDGAGATNPSFEGTGLLTSYNPVAGSVGDKAMASAEFVAAGTLAREVT